PSPDVVAVTEYKSVETTTYIPVGGELESAKALVPLARRQCFKIKASGQGTKPKRQPDALTKRVQDTRRASKLVPTVCPTPACLERPRPRDGPGQLKRTARACQWAPFKNLPPAMSVIGRFCCKSPLLEQQGRCRDFLERFSPSAP